MKNKTKRSKLLDCNLYDFLESWAVKKERVDIFYRNKDGFKNLNQVLIEDLFVKKQIEFLRISDDEIIPLLDLISVNGIPFQKTCD